MILDNQNPSFWLENITDLFGSGCFFPSRNSSFEEKMNAVTRLVLILFCIFLLFYSLKASATILCFLLVIIACTYYWGSCFTPTIKELYGDVPSIHERVNTPPIMTATNDLVISPTYNQTRKCHPNLPSEGKTFINPNASNPQLIDGRQSSAFCYQNVPFEETISDNQKLVGKANPKTLIQPVIPNPIYDTSTWQPNDFVVPNAINDQKRQELYQNGYVSNFETVSLPSLCCPPNEKFVQENFTSNQNNKVPISQISFDSQRQYPPVESYQTTSSNNYQELNDVDLMDFGCGYQPLNLDYNLPSNYTSNECQWTQKGKEYNNNLFEIPLQPGVYTKSQVNQTDASQSNLGISFTTPFYPTEMKQKDGYSTFVELDPYQNKPQPTKLAEPKDPFRRNIFDPRLNSYGTQYRSYIDPMTGQPRYYYRDIDQQNQNGYLTRNKIDFAEFGTTTGVYPFDKPLEGNALHQYADNTYTNSQIGYRTELQQRLMHKNSNREWQQRMAPIYRNQQTKGFMGTNSSKAYAGPRGG